MSALLTMLFAFVALPVCASEIPKSSGGDIDLISVYGQGFDFWTKVQDLNSSSKNPIDALRLLDASFDHPEEGIATFLIRFQGPVDGALNGLANRGYFGAGFDGLAGGIARNRILPEVQAYATYTGHVDFGLMERVPHHESGWEYRLGSTLGAGQSSLVNGAVLDLIGHSSTQTAALFYSGLDLELGFKTLLSQSLKSHYSLSAHPTLFHSDFSGSSVQYKIEADQINVRWRQENEWTLILDTPFEPEMEIGLLAIAGQQPTPIQILPRTWDAVHDLSPWPSAGQLVGMGTRFHIHGLHDHLGLMMDGGFYGGYLGASGLIHIYGVQLVAGTYGFEQSSSYRSEGSRITFASVGAQIAL